ncbi:cytochrome c biogenesis protein ResB [Akkermansiaceae bacterium]|nr:cytochrome c biogenesis protein ResB [Akkermansiaceae bacterium]
MSKNSPLKKRTPLQWVVRIFTGYEIMVTSIVLLIAIVFFSTLEQAETGLYAVKQRYYAMDVFFVQPILRGKLVPIILPGAYWVCAIFTLNLICGGIVKMGYLMAKKTRREVPFEKRFGKFVGVFTSHISMAVMMIAGAVDYHMSSTTMLDVVETKTNHIGYSDEDVVIEVSEIKEGVEQNVHVVSNKLIDDMILNNQQSLLNSKKPTKTFTFKDFPFEIKFNGWYRNANIFSNKTTRTETDGELVDGKFIREDDILTISESERIQSYNQSVPVSDRKKAFNLGAAYLDVVDTKGNSQKIIVSSAFTETGLAITDPVTVNIDGKTYGFKLTYKSSILPFDIFLKELDVNTYQGTSMARDYISHIEYEFEGKKESATISMNEPFRKGGYTVYQARWQQGAVDMDVRNEYVKKLKAEGKPLTMPENMRLTSVYQVVSNPADRWPEYCIYVCAIGLLFHFGLKLSLFTWRSFNKEEKNEI